MGSRLCQYQGTNNIWLILTSILSIYVLRIHFLCLYIIKFNMIRCQIEKQCHRHDRLFKVKLSRIMLEFRSQLGQICHVILALTLFQVGSEVERLEGNILVKIAILERSMSKQIPGHERPCRFERPSIPQIISPVCNWGHAKLFSRLV